jgi:hypothetical protein
MMTSRASSLLRFPHSYLTGDDLDLSTRQSPSAFELVARNHDRRSGPRGSSQNVIEFVTTVCIETRVGFVEQPQLGTSRHQAGQCHPALLSSRQRCCLQFGKTTVETESSESPIDVCVVGSGHRSPETDILRNRQVCVQTIVMREIADMALDRIALVHHIVSEHRSRTPLDGKQTSTHFQQTRLSCPIGSAQQHDLTAFDAQRRTGKSRKRPENRNDIVENDDGLPL